MKIVRLKDNFLRTLLIGLNFNKLIVPNSLQLLTNHYLCCVKTELNKLKTIKNYAVENSVTAVYIYKLIKGDKMRPVIIDGVQFIDTAKYPVLPTRK